MEPQAYRHIQRIERDLWWYRGRRRLCRALLRRVLGEDPGRPVLDVGCGTGFNLGMLSEFGQVEGIEPSPEGLACCRERGLTRVIQGEAVPLPFPDERFGLVTALDVIEHIEDDLGALREFRRVLRRGGHLLVTTPALPLLYGAHDRIVGHHRRYMAAPLRRRLVEAGLEPVHLSYHNLLVLPAVLAVRLALALWPRRPHVEMSLPPAPVNEALAWLCELEAPRVLGRGLPLGLSLIALARRRS